MISDTIDILDAKIINLQIHFEISANLDVNKEQVLSDAYQRLSSYFITKMEVGESLIISEIYNQLNKTRGVSDVLNVTVKNVTTSGYSSVGYDIDSNLSADGKILFCPKNAIFVIKRLVRDIKGVVK